jgi:hypothetical protein
MSHLHSRRAWSVLIVIGSVLTAAAIWNSAAIDDPAINPRRAHLH